MKIKRMKISVFLFLISIILITGCKKENYESTGTITGQDLALCACCGGYFIEIDGIQYRFEKSELPNNFTFEDNQLPLQFELDWKLKTDACTSFNRIEISKIRKK
jgi:hypothetical protein